VGGHAIVEVQGRKTATMDPGSRILPRFGLFTGFWF
jgi:hypothetical protein